MFRTFMEMRSLSLILCLMAAVHACAQRVQVYGRAGHGGKGEAGVMVMIFEGDQFTRRIITDQTGTYRFYTDGRDYTVLYYKPGIKPRSVHIINTVLDETVKFPVDIETEPVQMSADSFAATTAAVGSSRPELSRMYITAVYEYEKHASRRDTFSRNTRRALIRQAIAERDRFANYKKSAHKADKDSSQHTTIAIGPDTYEEVTDPKGARRYYKNDKPITEVTYRFETTRRYEGVLKNKRDVRRFEKYDAMQHVK
ncbi:MAG: hypothetical protein JSS76_15355 [Bacteroidetes bacterium]|nr:hypothetical protein [Bacteroidota bacterium]